MTLAWPTYLQQRTPDSIQLFPCPGATRTIMVCSHIWWTEQIALAIHNAGFNLLLHPPLYLLYARDEIFGKFDQYWDGLIQTIRNANVDIMLGGNTSAIAVHPRTGEMIHDAASRPDKRIRLVNWWWDEVRTKPPLERAGISPQQYISLLANPTTLNAIWDQDVLEELAADFNLPNMFHLPLATLLEFWPPGYIPLEKRPLAACFLGHCHYTSEWIETDDDPLTEWARQILRQKLANPMRSMADCIRQTTGESPGGVIPKNSSHYTGDAWIDFQRPIEFINAGWMHYTRNKMILAAERRLGGKLALIGKGWEKLGLRANMDHAGEKSGHIYSQSQICLNLFGGCVHGGMPLRPYDIGASGGLIVTYDQRELPALFEPGKECVTFRNEADMVAQIDRIRAAPAEYNAIAQAGRRRVQAEHTWTHRIQKLMQLLDSRPL